jgi:YHS domain-containing protein
MPHHAMQPQGRRSFGRQTGGVTWAGMRIGSFTVPIIDPVSNQEIDDVEYPQRASYDGHTYAFASLDNYHEFQKDPAKFADPSKAIADEEQ